MIYFNLLKEGVNIMDKLVRKIEVPLAKNVMHKNNLYLIKDKDVDKLAEVAMDAYIDYPLHNHFTGGKYNAKVSKLIMKISLKTMLKDAVIYADSEEMNGFAVFLPFGFTGSKVLPFLFNGGLKLLFVAGPRIIGKLIKYESFAMKLKNKYTKDVDWYLYNLSIRILFVFYVDSHETCK